MTKETLLETTKAFLFDLDGTLTLGGRPLGRAAQTLRALRAMGKRIVFLTNNSSKTREAYRLGLERTGLWQQGDEIYTSNTAAIAYLNGLPKRRRVFLLSTRAVRGEYAEAGIELDETHPDLLLLAYDTELTYEKLCRFDAFLRAGTEFFATHPDDVCPAQNGSVPDVGSFLALFERSSGRKPDLIVGKPYPPMRTGLESVLRLPKEEMCMVGDRLYTDIRFANRNGMKSELVLSGETKRSDLAASSDRPDLVLDTADALAF